MRQIGSNDSAQAARISRRSCEGAADAVTMQTDINYDDRNATGLIADFQRFSLHDGPGIRMTVFMKGCNMRCAWCHNPETIYPKAEYLWKEENCIHCGGCEEGCFAGARVLCGTEMTVAQVLEEIKKERPYFGQEGGVTISGGEPGVQAEFAWKLLRACRKEGIHTAVETNMSLPPKQLRPLWQQADLILADLKLWDDKAHRRWTGIGNERIKENLRTCAAMHIPLILHTPVMAGVNDTPEEIGAIARFAGSLDSLLFYELLPYHPLGLSKGKTEHFASEAFQKPDGKRLEELARLGCREGIEMRVAGKRIVE